MRMLKSERQNELLKILLSENHIVSSDIAQRLGVSEDTIRRDIIELDKQKKLKRVHSGATRIGPKKTRFSQRLQSDIEEKKILAQKALSLITPNSLILIDDGTTNYELIKTLDRQFSCTIATNSIPIIALLEEFPNINVISIGGTLFKESMSNLGTEAIRQVELLRPDLYIMGVYSLYEGGDVTHTTYEEAILKKKMMEVSYETAALVTKEKLGVVSNFLICQTDQINYLVKV